MHNNAYLVDYEHGSYSPSNPVLEVAVSDGKAFLAIGHATETYDTRSFTASEQIGVDVEELIEFLVTMQRSDLRQAAERAARQAR